MQALFIITNNSKAVMIDIIIKVLKGATQHACTCMQSNTMHMQSGQNDTKVAAGTHEDVSMPQNGAKQLNSTSWSSSQSSRAVHANMDSIPRQTFFPIQSRHLVRKWCSKCAVSVCNITLDVNWETLCEGWLRFVNELVIETDVELVVLLANTISRSTWPHLPCWL